MNNAKHITETLTGKASRDAIHKQVDIALDMLDAGMVEEINFTLKGGAA